ncbi:MAG: Xaa-Pro peptidase family protein [Chloroflexota bacterium]
MDGGAGSSPWFTKVEFEDRLAALRRWMADDNLDGVLLFEPESVTYITGFYTFGYTSSFQAAIVTRTGEPLVIVRHSEVAYLDRTSPFSARHVWVDGQEPADIVANAARAGGLAGARVGIEMRSWMLNAALFRDITMQLPGTRFVDVSARLAGQRLRKSPAEVAYIEQASRIAERAMDAAVVECRAGATENDVAAAVFAMTTILGADRPDICIASGEAADNVHGLYTGRILQPGDLVAVEVVPSVNHYHARFMRTIVVPPVPAAALAMAERLVEVQDRALATVRPGVPASVPDTIYREGILGTGLVGAYPNKTFYSVGLMLDPNAAEGLEANPASTWSFEEGQVFHTYLAVKGFTFSETVLITAGGCRSLTTYPRQLLAGR